LIHVPWGKGLDHDSCILGQPFEELSPVFTVDVKCYASLIGTVGEPEEALFGVSNVAIERANASGSVSPGLLYANDISSEVGQDLGTQNAFLIGEVKYPTRIQHGPGFS